MKIHIYLLSLIVALLTVLPVPGFGEEKDCFEIGVGAGTDLAGIGTKQLLLAPAFSMPISPGGSLRARIEGDFEIIDYTKKTVFVGGIAPFLKLLPFGWNINPFMEIGAGGNLITNKTIGDQHIGGPFMFSLMSGAGIETMINKTPISLSYRFRHLSNARIYKDNEGFNAQYIMLSIGL